MSRPSTWPLPPESIRYLVPKPLIAHLQQHRLSSDLYPMAMGYYAQAAGHHMERQSHDDYLLIYCLQGRGAISAAGQEARLESGDLLLIPEGLAHQYYSSSEDPWTIYWTHFQGEQAADFCYHTQLALVDGGFRLQHIGVQSQLIANFEALLDARNSAQDLTTHICASNQLRQILTHIALLRPLAELRKQRAAMEIERVHALMQAHVHEKLDLDTLAASVNLSKYHFVKRYREITGTTPINRFIQLKIERACHLLDTTDNEIKAVAFAVGYEDAYYFSRVFRKQLGLSPSQYRASRT